MLGKRLFSLLFFVACYAASTNSFAASADSGFLTSENREAIKKFVEDGTGKISLQVNSDEPHYSNQVTLNHQLVQRINSLTRVAYFPQTLILITFAEKQGALDLVVRKEISSAVEEFLLQGDVPTLDLPGFPE